MNYNQEEYVFKAFKKLYSRFPAGECIRDEQPDYIVYGADSVIGIEITQIFIDNHIDSSLNEKRMESLQSMLGENLCDRLDPKVPFKFVLSIDFSKKGFAKSEIPLIVKSCETYVKQLHFPQQDFNSIDLKNWGQLPDQIENLNLFKFPSLKKSLFSEVAGSVLPELTEKNLQVVLTKKGKALKQYKACDEHWLLIEEGTFVSDSFGDIAVNRLDTNFNKVFLYRHSKGQVVQLK
jgi:hypothetical protein